MWDPVAALVPIVQDGPAAFACIFNRSIHFPEITSHLNGAD